MTDDNSPALSMGITGREPMLGGAKKISANALYIEGIGYCEFSINNYPDNDEPYIAFLEVDSAARGIVSVDIPPGHYRLLDVRTINTEDGNATLYFDVVRLQEEGKE